MRRFFAPFPLLAVVALAACSGPAGPAPQADAGFSHDGRRALFGLVDTTGTKQGMTYAAYSALRERDGPGTAYADYACTGDCGDIRAGYQVAKLHGTIAADRCGGKTWGELEGCVAFTQHLKPEMTQLPPSPASAPAA